MKKKVLLLLVLGVSFTPAVFARDLQTLKGAAEELRGKVTHTGELTKDETTETATGSVVCEFLRNKAVSEARVGGSAVEGTGSAISAEQK